MNSGGGDHLRCSAGKSQGRKPVLVPVREKKRRRGEIPSRADGEGTRFYIPLQFLAVRGDPELVTKWWKSFGAPMGGRAKNHRVWDCLGQPKGTSVVRFGEV